MISDKVAEELKQSEMFESVDSVKPGFLNQMCIRDSATTELCEIMLKDSAHIQQFEAEWKNRKAKRAGRPEVVPLYDINDAMGVMEHFVPCPYAQKIEMCIRDSLTDHQRGSIL